MLEPIFKLIPVKNYRHPYEVKKVFYMETGDPRFTYAVINLVPTNKNIKNTSVHDKFHRALVLSGFFFLKIASTFLNSSFFPKTNQT